MREILFRGKSIDDGKWKYSMSLARHATEDGIITSYHIGSGYDIVKAETVGQYTGLTDKNGKKIFEGDIIRYADIYDYNCYLESLDNVEAYDKWDFGDIWTVDKVVYGIDVSYPAFDLCRHDFDCNGLSELVESMQYHYEVIGNIHDNPELLKGGEG